MRKLDDGSVLVEIVDTAGILYRLALTPEHAKALGEELLHEPETAKPADEDAVKKLEDPDDEADQRDERTYK
jgi:hypothetical protein